MQRIVLLLFAFAAWRQADGHGRLMDPPGRSTMWRFGFSSPPNYDDNGLNCGGFAHQWETNDGKCGMCGDPWDGVRANEDGGKYSTGQIVRKYKAGQLIKIMIELTTNHGGWFEFRICPYHKGRLTTFCLRRRPLRIPGHGRRFHIDTRAPRARFAIEVKLPKRIKCKRCLIQWKYNAAQNRGSGPQGVDCYGCGKQEQFYACADVAIGSGPEPSVKMPKITTNINDPLPNPANVNGGGFRVEIPRISTEFANKKYMTRLKEGGDQHKFSPAKYPKCGKSRKPSCFGVGVWRQKPGFNEMYCQPNCPIGLCDKRLCVCACPGEKPQYDIFCQGVVHTNNNWCLNTCLVQGCPEYLCVCKNDA